MSAHIRSSQARRSVYSQLVKLQAMPALKQATALEEHRSVFRAVGGGGGQLESTTGFGDQIFRCGRNSGQHRIYDE